MIFLNNKNNNSDIILSIGEYKPYRIHGERNPLFDDFSKKILDVKDSKEFALEYFFTILDRNISKGVSLCVVPSHDPQNTESGMGWIAQKLAQNGRVDATSCLVRKSKILKLAHGGNRSKEVHLNSIDVNYRHIVKNKLVLLLDDVTTSNNSLLACKELLLRDGGASIVQCFALAKTEGY